jgi:hypothetical protein
MQESEEEEGRLLGHNPLLDDDTILSELFGARPAGTRKVARLRSGGARLRPTHYRIVSFSLYQEDIARLEALVRRLKELGHSRANKSQVVRYALATVDVEHMPRSL